MQDRNITPEESLSIIQQMINNTRQRYADDGFYFLLWGILVILGNLNTYYALKVKAYALVNPVWMVLIGIGIVASIVMGIKRDGKKHFKSQAEVITNMLWLAFLISWFLMMYVSYQFKMYPYPFFFILLGLATFVSGAIVQFVPLYIGGIVFWIGAIIGIQLDSAKNSLLMAAAMLLGYIIPGILLRIKVKKERNV